VRIDNERFLFVQPTKDFLSYHFYDISKRERAPERWRQIHLCASLVYVIHLFVLFFWRIIIIIMEFWYVLYLLSYEDSKRGEMSLLPNTETTHNSYAAFRRKDNTNTAQKHKAQWHLTTLTRKENREFMLEFNRLYHYHLKEIKPFLTHPWTGLITRKCNILSNHTEESLRGSNNQWWYVTIIHFVRLPTSCYSNYWAGAQVQSRAIFSSTV
jgi:hypothetical protein